MSRRALTLLLASALAFVLTAAAGVAQVPYVALGPGPMYDTLGEFDGRPLLEIDGRETYPTDGHLDLTTVRVSPKTGNLTLAQALHGWLDRKLAVVPREAVYPPDKSPDEVEQENNAAMAASHSSATLAAARQLGLRTAEVSVREVPDGSPSQGLLQEGDVLTGVDGRTLRDAAELRDLIAEKEVGEVVRIAYRRDGSAGTAEIRTAAADDAADGADPRPVVGVVTQEEPVDLPFDVDITLEEVGGPSAGLMFALAILEKLDEESLTGGSYVAGTGAISPDGSVLPIGGISQKVIAAAAKGADAFLVPEGNCADAVTGAPDGLTLVSVA